MLTGFSLSILLGLLWMTVGVIVTDARRQNCSIWYFYCFSSAISAAVCWIFWGLNPQGLSRIPGLLLFIVPAAMLNAGAQSLTMYNLRTRSCALAFSIPQINFILPFLFSILILDGRYSLLNILGLMLITAAILSARPGHQKRQPAPGMLNSGELLRALASAILGGTSQIFLLCASRSAPQVPPILKSALMLTAASAAYGLGIFGEKATTPAALVRTLRHSILWSLPATLSYYVLFQALAVMSRSGHSGLVFALACSTAILSFWLYSLLILHDRISRRQILVFILILSGIIFLRLC